MVVGAGVAGCVAARRLVAEGADVVVVDKGVSAGGRVATRRVDGAHLDHGAQFFSVRSDEFASLVDELTREGCGVRVWGEGFAQARHVADGPDAADAGGDGHPRYSVTGGLNRLVRTLADPLDVRTDTRVDRVSRVDAGWEVGTVGGERVRAGAVVLTPPVPQSLAIAGAWMPSAVEQRLSQVAYDPCVALLVRLDGAPALPSPGGVQLAQGPVCFLGDNVAKGASDEPAVTVHLDPRASADAYDRDDDLVADEVLTAVAAWLGDARVRTVQVKRWRYSQPRTSVDDRAVVADVDGAPVVFAGDAFGEAKVEGAARSGMAAARALTTA